MFRKVITPNIFFCIDCKSQFEICKMDGEYTEDYLTAVNKDGGFVCSECWGNRERERTKGLRKESNG